MTALLAVRGLRLEAPTPRGTARILRGIHLDVGRGRIVGVVGESGSGKSSLALALLRLLPGGVRLSGQALMEGVDLVALPEAEMRRRRGRDVAMIFQDPATALNPLFSVGTHLMDVLRRRDPGLSRADRRGLAEAALRRVEIADPARRLGAYPHELSGGMRQRVMIAMGLIARPALLLADEPTTALDATVEAGIIELFRGLRAELGGAILFISHDLGLVAGLCDDLAVLYGGLVVESGPVAAVTGAPAHPYTAALLACTLEGEGRLPSIPGDVPDPAEEPAGCIFAPRCPLVEGRCRVEPQPLRPAGPGHAAACWKTVGGGG